ncbi:hypothetical protein Pmani_025689 [Petrolisthes manimaculis]|uniref:Uncharacterized protein n=1 Tax=Petrolisthes manimaculis TaxID=1843537 RepID=A0AAE1TY55_9EUCA|nr:hypothetical protein Pmani_025689 [Petrolisthes manimaculis]
MCRSRVKQNQAVLGQEGPVTRAERRTEWKLILLSKNVQIIHQTRATTTCPSSVIPKPEGRLPMLVAHPEEQVQIEQRKRRTTQVTITVTRTQKKNESPTHGSA